MPKLRILLFSFNLLAKVLCIFYRAKALVFNQLAARHVNCYPVKTHFKKGHYMKSLLLSAALLFPSLAQADSYILGAGRWTCEEVLTANQNQDMAKVFQAVGWLFGYWSAETKYRDNSFVDVVENVGGRAIFDQTLVECGKAPEGTLLYELADSMIGNTG